MSEVLYVHPYGHVAPDIIPAGAISGLNLLSCHVTGRYAHEVSQKDLDDCRIITLDLHWMLPLHVLSGMLREVRQRAPHARIVLGGITASFYAPILFRLLPVDYILVGDAEVSFAALIDCLLQGSEPPRLPNVSSVRDPWPERARVSQRQFDALDWITIDWFPSYHQRMLALHTSRAPHRKRAEFYPFLPLVRGCPRQCGFCYGAYQERVFGRQVLVRSGRALLRDLERICALSTFPSVSLFAGDMGISASLLDSLRGHRFALDAYIFGCGAPEVATLRNLRDVFTGDLAYSIIQPSDLAKMPGDPPPHQTGLSFARALTEIKTHPKTCAFVYYTTEASETALAAAGEGIELTSGHDWNLVRPDQRQVADEEGLEAQLHEVRKAAGHASTAMLLHGVVPALTSIPVLAAAPDDTYHPLQEQKSDPFERRLVELCSYNLLRKGYYGFDGLELEWFACRVDCPTDPVSWGIPEKRLFGRCDWTTGMQGYSWHGTVGVESGASVHVAPVPVVLDGEGQRIELASWPLTRVPAVRVEPGPRRDVRMGGTLLGEKVRLEIDAVSGVRTWILDRQSSNAVHSRSRLRRRTQTRVLFLHVRGGHFAFDSAIAALAGVARQEGADFATLSIPVGTAVDDVLARIEEIGPHVVAASVAAPYLSGFRTLFSKLKDRVDALTIVGGVYPTMRPQEIASWTGVDVIGIGEGERPFARLLRSIRSGERLCTGPGLWVSGRDGWMGPPPLPDPELDISANPAWAYDAFEEPRIISVTLDRGLTLRASRGCPFSCSYCGNRGWETVHGRKGKPRVGNLREIESLCEEMVSLRSQYDMDGFVFWDPLFPTDRRWLERFAEVYSRDVCLPFEVVLHPKVVRPWLVELLARAGCDVVRLGIEVGDEPFRRRVLNRPVSNAEIEACLQLLGSFGIRRSVFVMWNLPGESPTLMRRTIDFVRQLAVEDVSLSPYFPLPATVLGEVLVSAVAEPTEHFVDRFEVDLHASLEQGGLLELASEMNSLRSRARPSNLSFTDAADAWLRERGRASSARDSIDSPGDVASQTAMSSASLVNVQVGESSITLTFALPERHKVIVEPKDLLKPAFLKTEHLHFSYEGRHLSPKAKRLTTRLAARWKDCTFNDLQRICSRGIQR